MRWTVIKTVFGKELRELLRDRRSLLIMFGIPLVLYPAMMLAFGSLSQDRARQLRTQPVRVGVVGIEHAPVLQAMLVSDEQGFLLMPPSSSDIKDDRPDLHLVVPRGLEDSYFGRVPLPAQTQPIPPPDASESMSDDQLEANPIDPQAAIQDPLIASARQQELAGGASEDVLERLTVIYDSSRSVSAAGKARLAGLLERYRQKLVELKVTEAGLDPSVLQGLEIRQKDLATQTRQFGQILSAALPALLLITGALGAFFPALASTTTEREMGTLETLLVSPASRVELLAGKVILVMLCGTLTAGLNMGSMSLVMWRVVSAASAPAPAAMVEQANPADAKNQQPATQQASDVSGQTNSDTSAQTAMAVGQAEVSPSSDSGAQATASPGAGKSGGVGGGVGGMAIDPKLILAAFVSAVPTLALFSSLMLLVGMLARSFREANSFTLPVMLLPMASMAVGIIEPATTSALLATPVIGATVVMRDILLGEGRLDHALFSGSMSLLLSVGVLVVASRLFSNEQLVNPSWEPLSFKSLRRRNPAAGPRPRRLPRPDEVLVLFSVVLLAQFYIGPALQELFVTETGIQLYPLLAAKLIGLVLLPAVLLSVVFGYDLIQTFRIVPSSFISLTGGAMMGIGLAGAALLVAVAQQQIFGSADSQYARNLARLLMGHMAGNQLFVTAAVIGILAGVCEELVFRGVVLTGLRKSMPAWAAASGSAFLFALAHFDMSGFAVRFALGLICAAVVFRTGSIIPAILIHTLYDASLLIFGATWIPSAIDIPYSSEAATVAVNFKILCLGLGGCLLAWVGWLMTQSGRDLTLSTSRN